jgi:hypothetical protein
MAPNEKKLYDYEPVAVRDALVKTFAASRGESTIADLAGRTGLPLSQIEAELPAVADEYGARLKVAESGDILYSFPAGMKSRYRGLRHDLSRAWKAAKKGLAAAAKLGFKVWIATTLVGYFVFFIALTLFALVASVAVQQGGGDRDSRSDRRGGGLGGLWLTGRLLDSIVRIWFYSELFKDPRQRATGRGFTRSSKEARRPLHKAIFSHVFGDGDPNASWEETEKKAVVAFLQTHRGVITLPEFMAVTGLSPARADDAINRYLLEFEGSPEVSDGGSIYFFFPKLLSQTGETPRYRGDSTLLKRLEKFSSNEPKADKTFRAINLVNVVFGGYFLYNAFSIGSRLVGGFSYVYSFTVILMARAGIANPIGLITWVLGLVPLAFSALFFLIPILRKARLDRGNEAVKAENLKRIIYRAVVDAPENFRPELAVAQVEEANPRDPGVPARIAEELAAWSGADPVADGWTYREIARTQAEAKMVRQSVNLERYKPGETVFDTDR